MHPTSQTYINQQQTVAVMTKLKCSLFHKERNKKKRLERDLLQQDEWLSNVCTSIHIPAAQGVRIVTVIVYTEETITASSQFKY